MRIADLKPDFGTALRHPNRPREALDASPHLNGSGPLGVAEWVLVCVCVCVCVCVWW